MVAKIGRGNNLYGALAYNQQKVDKHNGKVLFANKMIETKDGNYTVAQLAKSFEPYLLANRKTEKTSLHISLNPDSKDQVSDEKFIQMAQDYMNEMGYGNQPYVVFKHTDISRTHIHIVSVGIDEEGRKISDKFEKRKSMKVCRELERKYGLVNAENVDSKQNEMIFKPVNYQSGDVKRQVASVVRNISKYYHFQTIGEFNALLSLFNITSEKVESIENGVLKNGLLYFALNEKGEKISKPFKSSLFGRNVGLEALEEHFMKSKELMKSSLVQKNIKDALSLIMKSGPNEKEFKEALLKKGISTVIRKNESGRIYGMTFIDYQSKSVWNGSRLGKEFSANAFNQIWNVDDKTIRSKQNYEKIKNKSVNKNEILKSENPHELFSFLDSDAGFLTTGIGFLPEIQGEDYEELDFENRMKKKRKRATGRS